MKALFRISLLLLAGLIADTQGTGAEAADGAAEPAGEAGSKGKDDPRWAEQEEVSVILDEVPAGPTGARRVSRPVLQ